MQETGYWPKQAFDLAGQAVHELCLTYAEQESHFLSKTPANSTGILMGT